MMNLRTAAAICLLSGMSAVNAENSQATLEANKAVVKAYMTEVANEGKLESYQKYFSEDVTFNGLRQVKQHQMARRQALNKAFPDHHTTIEDQIAEGDRVVTRVTFKGTHLGEFNGIAPTGKVLTYSGVAVDRVVDGKVVEMWHVASPLELPIQIGVVLAGLPAAR